ncbi:MAG: hypothetical protein HFH47_02360 [Bacilli bacterium]|nr:hypothetical protein [Bacilli bacterium]
MYRDRIDTGILKRILELDVQRLKKFDFFMRDFERLINNSEFKLVDFIDAYHHIDNLIMSLRLKKEYKNFMKKYKEVFEIEFVIDVFHNYRSVLDFHNYILHNFDKKDIMLQNLSRLMELEINKISFDFKDELDGKYEFLIMEKDNDRWHDKAIATDGKIIWQASTKNVWGNNVYPVVVDNAGYVLIYEKRNNSVSEDCLSSFEMNLKSLIFDINTLPSYEMLHSADVLPPIDYEAVDKEKGILNKKNGIVNQLYSIDEISELTNDLLEKLSYLTDNLETVNDREKVEEIISKIEVVKSLYNDMKYLEEEIIRDTVEEGLMNNFEIQQKLQKKKNYIHNSCCSCC